MIARELLAFMHLVLFSVTLVFVTSVVDSEDCACTRGLFPVCSSTTGKYVASSSDCAVKCAHDKTAVGCMFLRYYSWRRRCSCSMHLPQRSGGVCEASSGILLSKDASCAQCQKIPEEYKSCSSLAEDLKPLLPPPVYEVDTGNVSWYSLNSRGRPGGCVDSELCGGCHVLALATHLGGPACPREEGAPSLCCRCSADVDLCGNLTCFEKNMYCNGSMDDLPACSMGTGALVAASGCQAAQLGHRYTMPCRFLAGRTSAPFFYSDDCLLGDGAPEFVGRVAGYTACQAVVHKCSDFQRRDGAMAHTLCESSDACAAEAAAVVPEWPECAAALHEGTGTCSPAKAKRVFEDAVGHLCRPFGPEDYSSSPGGP